MTILFPNFGFLMLPFRDASEFMLRMDLHKCLLVAWADHIVRCVNMGFGIGRDRGSACELVRAREQFLVWGMQVLMSSSRQIWKCDQILGRLHSGVLCRLVSFGGVRVIMQICSRFSCSGEPSTFSALVLHRVTQFLEVSTFCHLPPELLLWALLISPSKHSSVVAVSTATGSRGGRRAVTSSPDSYLQAAGMHVRPDGETRLQRLAMMDYC